ncbi:hypothetical protein PROH_19945 [Prochlorothrix hollandica PCC 9006 = CALU 1027]|uniref:Uncharacterized protein n=1 Tax=Prochlorothrix hollandica PCC 9006 = CALU 1027 TaxID=317619 RepID=A0A0M2PTM7_PROHO|nr:hypothetical protein [Prochlorothrix hollandica]KKI98023.1 hypothetical protein PROH_19945 [Prochlorothrix hollandica PCC 9006 = CALU 1027]
MSWGAIVSGNDGAFACRNAPYRCYSIVVMNNQIRNDYINALAYGQQNQDDLSQLYGLMFDGAIVSLVEVLRVIGLSLTTKKVTPLNSKVLI